jgi:hypothetical protein
MKTTSIALNLAVAISAFGLAALPATAAVATVKLADTAGNVVTVDSTGVVTFSSPCANCTTASVSFQAGYVAWMGTIGNFTVSNIQGTSQPNQNYPDLAVVATNNGSASAVLTASFSDVSFPGPVTVQGNPITTFSGGGSATYTYYVDNTNALFGTGSLAGSLLTVLTTPLTTPVWSTAAGATFSATEVEALTLSPASTFNGDNSMFLSTPVNPLSVACAVATGKMGTAYSSSVVASGGVAPYTFTITSGALPAGLSLNATSGLISGTPSVAGTFSYTIQVTDASGNTATSSCGMTLALGGGGGQGGGTITLTCPSSSATSGVAYSSTFTATGGTSPYLFSISTGKLPSGLKINSATGAVTGTPCNTGTVTFTGKVVDSTTGTALSATATCSVTIAPKPTPLSLTCAANSGTFGVPYSSAVVAKGGTAPYASYKLTSGALPPGLTLNTATGAITGTPTKSGTYAYVITVTDANGALTTDGSGSGRCSSNGCSITIAPAPPVSLKCPTSSAKVGAAYSSAAVASGGVAPYAFSITAGSLPPGLTLNTTTGAITGTPTTPGTSNVTILATDSTGKTTTNHNCSGGCSIVVAPAITISCPPTSATKGTAVNYQLTVTGGTAPYKYSVNSGSLPAGLTLNTTTGAITGTPTSTGTYSVSFKVIDKNGLVGVTNCNTSGCGGDNNNDGNNGWNQQGWGGDDNQTANAKCVTQITVCEQGQGGSNWGDWWGGWW